MRKSQVTFLLLFNSLKFSKTSLFCCNGYSHAIFTILFYESQVEQQRLIPKEKNEKEVLMTLWLFYYIFMT